MAPLVILLLLGATALVSEPPPISLSESKDEVAHWQKRAKWLSCLLLITQILNKDILTMLCRQSKFPAEPTTLRIKVNLLEQCIGLMTDDLAEKYLKYDTNLTPEELELQKKASTIKMDEFLDENSDIGLTLKQQSLLAQIEMVGNRQEMEREDQEYGRAPLAVMDFHPDTYPFPPESSFSSYYWLIAAGLVLLPTFYCEFHSDCRPSRKPAVPTVSTKPPTVSKKRR